MLLYVHSSIAIILMGKRELVALLNLSSWCLVMVERLFLAVPRGCLRFVIMVFPDHTHLLFFTCTNYFIILKKKISREHTKNPKANVWARPDVIFWAVGYHSPPPPPESQLAFHIYYVKYENTLTCKRISWDSGGGGDVLKIFFYFLYE